MMSLHTRNQPCCAQQGRASPKLSTCGRRLPSKRSNLSPLPGLCRALACRSYASSNALHSLVHSSHPPAATPTTPAATDVFGWKAPFVVLLAAFSILIPVSYFLGLFQGARSVQKATHPAYHVATSTKRIKNAPRFASITLTSKCGKSATFSPDVLFKYNVLKLFALPTVGRLLAVVAMAIPVSIIGGLLYRWASGTEIRDSITKSYTTWANLPGVSIVEEESLPATMVMHSVFAVGMLSFAVVLGIVTDDMSAAFEEVRSGNHPVAEAGHTVVLGHNRHLLPVLRQLATAMREREGRRCAQNPVVVLTDKDKQELDSEIQEQGLQGVEVLTRQGKASKVDDLQRVAAGNAGTVIMLHPEDMDSVAASSHMAASLAALHTVGGIRGQTLVMQMWEGQDDIDAAQVAYERFTGENKRGMVQVLGSEKISKVLAQCAVQPGLGRVLTDLLQQTESGCEFYFDRCPDSLAGKTYGEVRRHYQQAVPVGVEAAGGKLKLNPADDVMVGKGDRLAFVSTDAKHINSVLAKPYEVEEPEGAKGKGRSRRPVRKVVVLSFGSDGGSDTTSVVRGLDEFARDHTEVTVVSEAAIGEHASRCKVKQVLGSPASLKVLQEAGVVGADSVIITGLQHLSADDADAQVVASVLQLQRLQMDSEAGGTQHVVASVNNAETQDVLTGVINMGAGKSSFSLDAISPDDLISGIMTQVASEPSLNAIYGELFGGQCGCEMYLRDPQCYHLQLARAGEAGYQWSQIFEAARHYNETVIGCVTASGELLLGVDALEKAPLGPGAVLVSIAENF